MSDSRLLTPLEAQAVVEERIELFGLGALPRVTVTERDDHRWQVRWAHQESTVAPMTQQGWHAWLQKYVGPLDAADLVTTES
ncbi:MAG: hypothetical protein KAY46_22910 [Burkholderiaceae bacterium]|jgi:hypothetical protein|nr:hypothetical protein [Burkholderiaceae bacterium]